MAFFVARELAALGCAPSVIDAREVRLTQRPTQKSDRPVSTANLPLAATLVIDVPYAETGQCGEAQFPGPAPSPSCTTTSSGGATVKCR